MVKHGNSNKGVIVIALLLLVATGFVLGYWTQPNSVTAEMPATARKAGEKSTVSTATTSGSAMSTRSQSMSLDDEHVIKIVREYLLENPEILNEMSAVLQRRQQMASRQQNEKMVVTHRDAIFASPADYVTNPDGKIPVVEFFDYQCGYCKRVHADVTKLKDEQTDVRFIYKEFPILGPNSVLAAQAAIASKKQGKYVEYHNALMSNKGAINENIIMQLAASVGLDVARLKNDMNSVEVQAEIDQNLALGRKIGVSGTPTLIFGDSLVPGAIIYRQMALLVDQARKECKVC